ncbi:response regulator [Rhodococcus opacus]|uniref:Transcriptional regulatory protein n=1 Tax=Rhodococcus opacus TaxID=37919 RepID=A0AAX3YPJ4_RHOOP|nr:response regulator [Rhodococcus opacus]ELB92099.1 response regulator [Rhodococcus wratislaviensis IFP 2016]NHU41411.1 response regulator [Rhodococcus sp. A14]MBA8960517.1 response regulator of citrate/malate metabolism [Rhodococcus opacus]MBP2206082.1 response regulator of citrate/malate metabolism [Rhodococcus opacus]MCZ4585895.1 response regulator [Rhodococcus opacus]
MYEVLVVDDDFMVAEIHRRFVDKTPGFTTVGVARTAAEALESVRTAHPDLVLLDVYLPDMSGLDVLQQLRAEGNAVGVIMITAAREIDTVSRALHGGASDYLVKPFDYTQLQEKLENFRRRARALESQSGADQSLIDSLFGGKGKNPEPSRLPKGLSAETGRLVLDILRSKGELSSTECAELAGLSRVSVRRYLEHYLSEGLLEVRLEYGGAGRPVRRYRPAPR